MQIMNRLILFTPVLALVAAVLGGAGTGDRPRAGVNSGGSTSSIPQMCLTPADISNAMGFEVREVREGTRTYGNNVVCAYQATNGQLGAFVTTVVGAAEQSDAVFDGMRKSVKLSLGTNAEPEIIQVGERGQAYGSASKSEAAALSGGRLYHAEVVSSASINIGNKKAGMIEIVKKLMGR